MKANVLLATDTFNFFIPNAFVQSDTVKEMAACEAEGGKDCRSAAFPGSFRCRDVYDTWWPGKPGCHESESMVYIDEKWVRETMRSYAAGFARRHNVPVHCNQWGVKNEVLDQNGRTRYAEVMLNSFAEFDISSTYWIWRSCKSSETLTNMVQPAARQCFELHQLLTAYTRCRSLCRSERRSRHQRTRVGI